MNASGSLLELVAAVVMGYLLGSFPSGYLTGRLWGVDVRQHGSGRTGGTNVWRATGSRWSIVLTGGGDILKGVLAVVLARALWGEGAAALAGAAAVIGHIWSLFLGFKGGAGGGTAAAIWLVLNPPIGVMVGLLAVAAIYTSRYASMFTLMIGLGGLIVTSVLLVAGSDLVDPWHVVYAALVTIAIVITLRPNLQRLREGTERRLGARSRESEGGSGS